MGLKMTGGLRLDELVQSFYHFFKLSRVPGRAFPDNGYSPAFFFLLAQHAPITLLIICKLLLPFIGIVSIGIREFAAIMLVPVATMNKYGRLMTTQNNVRFYLADLATQPKSVAKSVQGFPGKNLWSGITGSDAGHHSAAGFSVNDVCHVLTFSQ